MPVMDGWESTAGILKTYRELSEQSGYAHLKKPVIFATTAYQSEATVRRCVSVGHNGILYKPVNRKGLHAQMIRHFPEYT